MIAAHGRGRFSHWQNNLVFSSSDGTDPRVNGRSYRYEAVRYAPPWSGGAGVLLIRVAGLLARRRLAGVAVALAPLRGVATSVGLTAGLVPVVFAAGELWFRLTTPVVASEFHIRFDPAFGFHFEPHSRVRATNHLDYWTEQEANALGLLDRPPREASALAGHCRVAVIGDSFVEAVQVPIDAKVHVVLETTARQEFKRRADRDNAALVILATHAMRRLGEALFARLEAMAASRGIAVVDQTAHIQAAGGTAEEAGFPHDAHWNERGHAWAAEPLLQHLVRHPELCAPR